ncbi:MAG: transglycosylase domain-containing protein [Actinomycetota bacterium]|nr:transglycosylase domain-containing protein [Actinomycetota bacterium]
MRSIFRLLTIALVAGLSLAVGITGLAFPVNALLSQAAESIPNPLLDIFKQQAQRSIVYAADGTVLAVLHATENRSPVSIDQVPKVVIDAVLDTEDARFFTHGGIDVKSTVRALASDVKRGAAVQGASTITQQLVKTVLNTPEKTLDRKLKDAVISTRLEGRYTKKQILEAYLNTVYFGNGAYGVQAAAETYFNENISAVTPVQAALLAGMIRDPQGYDPLLNPHDSTARRNFVLQRMVTQGHLSQNDATSLAKTPTPSKLTPPQGTGDTKDDYYVEQVKQILLSQSTTLGSTYSERYNALFKGGLRIYTNLDLHFQDLAEQSIAQNIPAVVTQNGFTGALASIDPGTGKVRAIIGGPGFDRVKYDLATQGLRQPGSGFKLFTLLAAYEAGYGPYDTVDGSSPCAVKFNGNTALIKKPISNDEGKAFGPLSVISATAGSVNCAFIRIAHEVGLSKVVEMAHRLGLHEKFPLNPSLVIGSEETTVLEMAGAYATLAADGVYHQPSFIDHVVDSSGATVFAANPVGKRVLDPQVARMAVMTLRAVVQYGTGTGASLPDRPVAGKTGTTELNTDAWFNGITPQLATTVWMGDAKGRTPMQYPSTPISVFGGTYPATIWSAYTEAALSGQAAISFPEPDPNHIPGGKFINSSQLRADSPTDFYLPTPRPTPSRSTSPSSTSVPGSVPVTVPPPPPTSAPTATTVRPPSTHPPTTCGSIVTPRTTITFCH